MGSGLVVDLLLFTLILVRIAAGLHVISWVAAELPKQCLVRNAHRHGLIIGGIEDYLLVPDPQGGLTFGDGKPSDAAILTACMRLL